MSHVARMQLVLQRLLTKIGLLNSRHVSRIFHTKRPERGNLDSSEKDFDIILRILKSQRCRLSRSPKVKKRKVSKRD